MPPPPPRCPPPPPGPPPGPGPPPPPMFNPSKSSSKSSSGDGRNLLLESIRQGKSLKKTVTVDKSAPVIGKASNNISVASGSMNSRNSGANATPSVAIGAGGNPLAGLFAGGMPKLKSTGRDIGQTNNTSSDSQSSSNRSSPEQTRPAGVGANNPTSPFPKQSNARRQTSNETKRGPPPQPPALKSPLPNSTSDSVLTGPVRNEMGSTSSRSQSSNISTLQTKNNFLSKNMQTSSNNNDIPNQSSLFGTKSNLHASLSSLHQTNQLTINTQNLGQSLTNLSNQNNTSSKSVINHGKPNLAPKPPAPTVKRGVSRAQSMRVPSTPPSTPPAQPIWPISGTLRGVPLGFHQSQENFRTSKPAPAIPTIGLNSRPNIPPPPRPPTSRPPPPPSRSTSNTNTLQTTSSSTSNLTSMNYNHSRSPSITCNNGANFKSNNNLVNNTGMNVPPPPPPHRVTPAPQPPIKSQLIHGVPAPPVRHSSMRNGAASDLEARFADRFHSVVDFPPPMPFYKIPKEYNSKMANHHNVSKQPSLSKPQAPPPPDRIAATHITFDTKLFVNNTSNC